MAFTKNPLTDGEKQELSVYSNDLENRIESATTLNSGSSTNGKWIKFDDGTAIYHGSFSYSGGATRSAGSYLYRNTTPIAPPSSPRGLFFGQPYRYFTAILDDTTTDAVIVGMHTQPKSNLIDILVTTSMATFRVEIGFLYIGRWK